MLQTHMWSANAKECLQEQQLCALGQHVMSEQGDSSRVDSAAAARLYLASTDAHQLRLSDLLLLAADHRLHAQLDGAGTAFSDDEAALAAAMFSPIGTISDMLATSDPFVAEHGKAVSNLAAADAVSFRLGEAAGLQAAYRRRFEVAAVPMALHSQHQC